MRTLLVDDVEGLRKLYGTVLEDDGRFEVVAEAGTGRAAIQEASKADPELVLLDISMPGMDGLEALPQIHEVTTDATVVMLSGFVEDRLGSRARDLGAVAYLEKGLSPDELVGELEDVLGLNGRPAPRGRARVHAERP